MNGAYNVTMEVEGTVEEYKIGFDYLPRKGDDLMIDFYGEEIIRYRVKEVMAKMFMGRTNALYPISETTYRIIVEEMSS